jgi:hypothetical protein
VERRFAKLQMYLAPSDRKRFALRLIPSIVAWLPVVLLLLSATALVSAMFLDALHSSLLILFIPYLVWLLGLGAIGAISFISVNAMSIQSGLTFDITNQRLLAVRIVLGALFGVVLSIPIGFPSFVTFVTQ